MDLKTESWFSKHAAMTIILIIIALLIVGTIGAHLASPNGNNNSSFSADLNAEVSAGLNGVTIANTETDDWSGCEVGVNGSCGFNFDSPPYQTHQGSGYSILAGSSTTIPYEALSSQDGTVFDPSTHAVNSVVVMCSMGTSDRVERSFCGAH